MGWVFLLQEFRNAALLHRSCGGSCRGRGRRGKGQRGTVWSRQQRQIDGGIQKKTTANARCTSVEEYERGCRGRLIMHEMGGGWTACRNRGFDRGVPSFLPFTLSIPLFLPSRISRSTNLRDATFGFVPHSFSQSIYGSFDFVRESMCVCIAFIDRGVSVCGACACMYLWTEFVHEWMILETDFAVCST